MPKPLHGRAASGEKIDANSALSTLEYLADLLRSGADLDRIVDGYLETRRVLAGAFQSLARADMDPACALMQATRKDILKVMQLRFGKAVPEDLLCVRAYGDTHLLLLGYLCKRVGRAVSAARLRLVTGDQVHTERRVRELRDVGFRIAARKTAGEFQYILLGTEADTSQAATAQLRANVKKSRTLGALQKMKLLSMLSAVR